MYKSPIEIYTENTLKEIVKQRDGYIFQEVQRIGVDVDKEELIRALKYDRDQYNAGYDDGIRDAVVHGRWILHEDGSATCTNCRRHTKHCWDYDSFYRHCPDCGAKMDLEVE